MSLEIDSLEGFVTMMQKRDEEDPNQPVTYADMFAGFSLVSEALQAQAGVPLEPIHEE